MLRWLKYLYYSRKICGNDEVGYSVRLGRSCSLWATSKSALLAALRKEF